VIAWLNSALSLSQFTVCMPDAGATAL
jgi:hypothetical protein